MRVADPWLLVAALSGLVAVVAGAYGWHGLAADEGARQVFLTGVRYQMWHSLALLAVAFLAERHGGDTGAGKWARRAGYCFAAGIVLFAGSMYYYGAYGDVPLPGVAPAGGALLMAGWVCLGLAAVAKA